LPMPSNYNSKTILKKIASQRGFGLIELLVSISIIALVSAVIMTKQSAFNGAVLLRNQAYEVAFDLRQAQLLAVSGTDNGATNVSQQYGVYFTTASRNSYIIFHDIDGDGMYDAGEQIGKTGIIDSRFQIRNLSYINNAGNNISEIYLHATFKRPNFDGIFRRGIGNGVPLIGSTVYIDIAKVGDNNNGAGDVRRIEITSTGQISVVTY